MIAYNDIRQLTEQLNYRAQHKNSIENAREAYRKQFDIGQRTLLDLLDTENEYFQAKRSHTNAQYDIQAAYARTYAAQGELLNKIGTNRQGLPDIQRQAYLDSENVCQAFAPIQMEIDKEALLANAKPLNSTILSLGKPLLATGATELKEATCSVPEVTNRVNDWATAWRKKDADNYLKFYADKFTPEGILSKADWEKQRRERLSANGKVGLKLNDLVVTCDGDKASAKFNQDYNLTTFKIKKTADTSCEVCNLTRIPVTLYSDKVNKELQFERVSNQWKIVRELVAN